MIAQSTVSENRILVKAREDVFLRPNGADARYLNVP